MESVGDFEYNTIIGHGAFAVVFKGRHKTKHQLTVAIKSITKKNLAKSQNLLEKEIKILKELTKLHHENVVALLDCKETAQHVYLVMEYCNGGDLADYLHDKGTLSEDTIRMFLRQIAGAMKALNAKGIVHRDLKPQNILLCHSVKQNPTPSEITLKIADFGFARFLQDGVMAVTLCGSPMYMAPEVIMSLQYTAKADLWSIGTIVFQCLTGKAPFQAQTPQALKQFYERNVELVPKIPSGTSAELIDLLLKLLKRNAADRLEFDNFFTHPFLKPIAKLSSPVPVPSRRSISPDIPSPVLTASPFGSPLSGNMPPSPSGWCTEQGGEDLAQDINLPTSSSEEAQASPVYREKSCPSSPEEQDFVMVPESLPYDITDEPKQGSVKWQQPNVLHRTPSNSSLPRKVAVQFTADGGAYYPTGKSSPTGSPRPSALPVTCSGTTPTSSSSNAYTRTEPIPVPTQRNTYEQIQRSLQESMSASPGSRSGHTAERSIPSPVSPPASPKLAFPRSQPINMCQESGSSQSSDRGRMSADISSLSPPTVQFAMGTPPGMGRTRSLSGSTPPQSVIWQSPPHVRQSNTPPQSLLSNSPIRRSSTNLQAAFNNGNPLSPIGSPPRDMSSVEQAMWSLKYKNDSAMQGLDSMRNVTNCSGPLQMAFGTRTMTLPEINSEDLWPGTMDRKESAEQFNYELQRAGSAGKICDKTMMKASGGSVCGLTSHSPQGARMIGYRDSHCPYWHGGAWEGHTSRVRHNSSGFGGRYGELSPTYGTSPPNMEGAIMFIAPELPEETLLEKEHNETLAKLNFVLALVDCILDLAKSKSTPIAALTESLMLKETNSLSGRIAVTSEGYRRAEQLVLYMRALQLLSSSLQLSRQEVHSGRLQPSTSVKNVLQLIKERFHFCLNMCKTLNASGILRASGVDPGSSNITADRLIYNYAIEMCQSAALEELFGNPEECFRRYQTAQILLHSLAQQVDHDDDKRLLFKYKEAVEKRLFVLQRQGIVHAYDST